MCLSSPGAHQVNSANIDMKYSITMNGAQFVMIHGTSLMPMLRAAGYLGVKDALRALQGSRIQMKGRKYDWIM